MLGPEKEHELDLMTVTGIPPHILAIQGVQDLKDEFSLFKEAFGHCESGNGFTLEQLKEVVNQAVDTLSQRFANLSRNLGSSNVAEFDDSVSVLSGLPNNDFQDNEGAQALANFSALSRLRRVSGRLPNGWRWPKSVHTLQMWRLWHVGEADGGIKYKDISAGDLMFTRPVEKTYRQHLRVLFRLYDLVAKGEAYRTNQLDPVPPFTTYNKVGYSSS